MAHVYWWRYYDANYIHSNAATRFKSIAYSIGQHSTTEWSDRNLLRKEAGFNRRATLSYFFKVLPLYRYAEAAQMGQRSHCIHASTVKIVDLDSSRSQFWNFFFYSTDLDFFNLKIPWSFLSYTVDFFRTKSYQDPVKYKYLALAKFAAKPRYCIARDFFLQHSQHSKMWAEKE